MSLLFDWTVATEEALSAQQTRAIVYKIEKNFDKLGETESVDYTKLTHADVYLLLSIYAFELYRFLCETGGNPPEPRSNIHEFLTRPDIVDSIRASGFKLFTAGNGMPNTFERVVFYYAGHKEDYKKKKVVCPKFREISNVANLSKGEHLFNLPFTKRNWTNLGVLEEKKKRLEPRERENYHILRFKLTCSNLAD